MGLLDIFRKKDKADGTYHRDRSCGGGTGNGYGTGEPFRITVEDVFGITGRGTVITGQVESGSVSAGDIVRLKRTDGSSRDVAITGDLRDFTPDMALSCAESLSQILPLADQLKRNAIDNVVHLLCEDIHALIFF